MKILLQMKEKSITLNGLMRLSQSDVDTLRRFVKSENGDYQDVTDVLTTVFLRVRLADSALLEEWDFDELFGFNVSLVLKVN